MPGVGFVESVAMTSLDRKVREPGDQGAESAKVAGIQKRGKSDPATHRCRRCAAGSLFDGGWTRPTLYGEFLFA